ncbi:MAG: NUDIX domain-containing protein [Deltaproteobacteria bacterium]|nr:NUDIX domain-containing protein [Deltaproteobacteria bacterium]
MTAPEEIVDVVDEDDRVVGRVTRAEMRRRNLLHRAVYIIVRNERGDFFVHLRTTTKDVYPGRWDVTVGGVVAAGESYEAAARRELAEETGIRDAPPHPLFDVRFTDPSTRLVGRVFLALHDGDVTLQTDEIAWGAFAPRTEVERIVREEPCCPDGVLVLRRYLASLVTTS